MQSSSWITPAINRRKIVGLCAAAFVLPASTGLWAQTAGDVQDEVWSDSSRGRDLPTLVRWPAGEVLGVVLFSHGLGGSRLGSDVWGKAWADAGFCVVHMQHPGSDAPSLRGGFGALRKAMSPEQLPARVGDSHFVLDEITRRHNQKVGRWAQVPLNKIGFAGHSFGARTAQALAGQAYPKAGGWKGTDPRITAFVMMSPGLSKNASLAQVKADAKASVRPNLVITGTLDGEVLNNGETPESRRMVYDGLPAGKKALLLINGADHMTFAGIAKRIPSTFWIPRDAATLQAEEEHHNRVAQVSTQWWKAQLLGTPLSVPTGLGAADVWLQG